MNRHFFTVDVEDYFHVSAFDSLVRRDEWGTFQDRVDIGLNRLLDLLSRHGATGTFFTLGWLADRRPDLVRRIAEAGHEVASHSHWHRRLTTIDPGTFREDLRQSKATIEDVLGAPVLGFRAPSFSLVPGLEWAFDVMVECGFAYDSSVFPIRRPGYGYPDAPLAPYRIERAGGALWEIPLSVLQVGGARVPAAGGGYLRHFPLGILQRAFRQRERADAPGVFYVHPWELDPEQPRLAVGTLTRVRHYRGLDQTEGRIDTLLRQFRFGSIRDWVAKSAPAMPVEARA
jgi:polysaccharide deacetylase family protein (PEP-CTERM system associated)